VQNNQAATPTERLVVTVCSTKGGVGKTTLAANLGGLLADLGYRVLFIDADIQPTLSSYYRIIQRQPRGLTALLTEGSLDNVICEVEHGLDLIYSDDPEGYLQNWILHTPDGRVRLKHMLAQIDWYDFIIVDTQGAVGPLQDAAVLAADLLVSPIPPEILSAREFARGTLSMLERLRPMQFLGAPIGPLYGVVYRMDRANEAARIADELRRESFAPSRGGIRILDTVIPSTVAYREAATARQPVHMYEPRRRGPSSSARDTMFALARELFPHIGVDARRLRSDQSTPENGEQDA
jgi:ATPases involved in chromosome partitioning